MWDTRLPVLIDATFKVSRANVGYSRYEIKFIIIQRKKIASMIPICYLGGNDRRINSAWFLSFNLSLLQSLAL